MGFFWSVFHFARISEISFCHWKWVVQLLHSYNDEDKTAIVYRGQMLFQHSREFNYNTAISYLPTVFSRGESNYQLIYCDFTRVFSDVCVWKFGSSLSKRLPRRIIRGWMYLRAWIRGIIRGERKESDIRVMNFLHLENRQTCVS